MPLKVLKNGMAYTSDIISAIDYADRMGVRIVNCSWESANYNPALKDMIDHSDMLFVCAAGNGHINIDEAPVYPAAFDSSNIISVASANKEGILSRFSNYGEYSIDVAAPGEDIMSAQPEDKYAFSSGSSLAAAFVSGEASLLLRTCGDDVYEIKDRIIKTSDRFSSLEGKTPGGRKVNSSQAVSNIASEEIIKVDVIDDMKYSTNAISSSEGENTLKTNAAWESKADLPDSKSGLAAVELDGKIYALGGWYRFHSLNKYRSLMSVHQYDPISDTWTQKRGMDGWRYKPAVAVNNRKIYVFGGMQDNSLFLNTMEEYDPQNDVWTKKANMPTARAGACAVAVNHLIYIIGGGNENGLLNTVDVYDTVTNTWTSAPNILAGRFGAGAALIDNKIYVAGGMLQNTLEIFDLSTNTWTLGASMSKPRFMGGLVAVGGRLFAVGGLTEPVAESQVDGYIETSIEEYMPLTDSWKVNSYMANRMHDFGITTYNNEIYIIGGANGDTDFNTTDVFLPVISENDQFTYIYDQNNRLIEIKKSSRSVATLHYDKNGNLIFIQLVE
jgi:N-acetylneuraminic acid mutarotase